MHDIAGQKFSRLTAIEPTGKRKGRTHIWRCLCECGGEALVAISALRSGLTKSCGCLKAEARRSRKDVHGLRGTLAYKSWDSMIQRCTNPNHGSFKNYGAIGITVCEAWRSFLAFLDDMGERPIGSSLDRKEPSLGYYPENCRWSDPVTQGRNKRTQTTTKAQADRVRALYLMGYPLKLIGTEVGLSRGRVTGVIYLGQVWQDDDHYSA